MNKNRRNIIVLAVASIASLFPYAVDLYRSSRAWAEFNRTMDMMKLSQAERDLVQARKDIKFLWVSIWILVASVLVTVGLVFYVILH